MRKIDKREMQWVRSLFRTSNTDERDVMGVYKGVMELVGINKELKKHIKCLKEVIRLKELPELKTMSKTAMVKEFLNTKECIYRGNVPKELQTKK